MTATPTVWTIGTILEWTKQYFSTKGIDNPRLDAEILLSHILKRDRLYLYVNYDQPLAAAELAAYREYVRQRAARMPVAYIIGEKEFFGLSFKVSPAVLVPRPETELLVEAVINRLKSHAKPRVLDLGTGSGAIVISILNKLERATAVAVDISPTALAVATENVERHNLSTAIEFRHGDLWQPVSGDVFDAIVSNPPYIESSDLAGLAPEVKHEPMLALDGGDDGLSYYRRLLQTGRNYLAPGGILAVELGAGQAPKVAALAATAGFMVSAVISDYAAIERVLILEPYNKGDDCLD